MEHALNELTNALGFDVRAVASGVGIGSVCITLLTLICSC